MGAPTGEGWYSPKDWFYWTYNLDQVEEHENYEAFKCVIKGTLLIAWMLHQSGLRQEIQELRRYYITNMSFRWDRKI